jgi:hypothetical protein
MLDGFVYCIFSHIEVVKIPDRCRLGPIYTPLVVIKDRLWCVCVVHIQVNEEVPEMLEDTSGFISRFYFSLTGAPTCS